MKILNCKYIGSLTIAEESWTTWPGEQGVGSEQGEHADASGRCSWHLIFSFGSEAVTSCQTSEASPGCP